MEFWTKVALLIGLLLIVVPALLRMEDIVYVDNSTFTTFFVIGILLIVIGNNNRLRQAENPRSAD